MRLDVKTQLYWLKGLTERFGAIHEFQVYQLKCYCAILPASGSIEVKVNPTSHIVIFESESKKRFKKTLKNKELLNLVGEWVKDLLWSDTEYIYMLNGKKVYDSRIDRQATNGTSNKGTVT